MLANFYTVDAHQKYLFYADPISHVFDRRVARLTSALAYAVSNGDEVSIEKLVAEHTVDPLCFWLGDGKIVDTNEGEDVDDFVYSIQFRGDAELWHAHSRAPYGDAPDGMIIGGSLLTAFSLLKGGDAEGHAYNWMVGIQHELLHQNELIADFNGSLPLTAYRLHKVMRFAELSPLGDY